MSNFVPFSASRKAMISSLKSMIKSKEFRPTRNIYNQKVKGITLTDFAVYAVLRGSDYRKTSHLREQGAANAKQALEAVKRSLENLVANPALLQNAPSQQMYSKRYIVGGLNEHKPEQAPAYLQAVIELHDLIAAALAA